MTQAERAELHTRTKQAEAFRSAVYQDSLGYWTIGFGRMVDVRLGGGITLAEAELLFAHDMEKAERFCERFPWFAAMDGIRQQVIVELAFNMSHRLLGFVQMLRACAAKDYDRAAQELEDSKWFQQVGHRGPRLVAQLRHG